MDIPREGVRRLPTVRETAGATLAGVAFVVLSAVGLVLTVLVTAAIPAGIVFFCVLAAKWAWNLI